MAVATPMAWPFVLLVVATAMHSVTSQGPWARGDGNWNRAWILKSFKTNETRLVGNGFNRDGSAMCNGSPFLLTANATVPNGACSRELTEANASCTCLTGLNTTNIWRFRVRQKTGSETYEVSALPDSVLDISSIASLWVPSTLQELSIVGETTISDPLTIPLAAGFRRDGQSQLVRFDERPPLTTVTLTNLDLLNVTDETSFLPSSVTNLTLRNCNITRFSPRFLKDLDSLVSLDLSGNKLVGPYALPTPEVCLDSTCPLKSLNLSYNLLTDLPSAVVFFTSLERLFLRGNVISNFTVSADIFSAIESLQVFELDQLGGAPDCDERGVIKMAHGIQLCVVDLSVDTKTSEANATNTYLLYAVIGGCVLIAVLLLVLVKQRSCYPTRRAASSKDEFESGFEQTFAFDESASATLLNDPLIITHRIEYKHIKVANCISKGGFGLVYSGVYRRRRVAIKKMRADRSTDFRQIEQFLHEICLMATLSHPRIVEFIGVAWDASIRNLCAVTEFMERGDLREVLHGCRIRNRPLTWETQKTAIALHVAEALVYLHSLQPKVIHRDLKAKNVLINSQFDAKLSDFGISRERQIEETHMTAGIGTSFWIAPEVLLGRDYDERADIYSFGVVLCEIDTDDYPFWNAKNPPEGGKKQENAILQMVAAGVLRPEFSSECPKAILNVSDMCLQADPDDRPTAQQLVYLLQQMLRQSSMSSTSSLSIDEA